MIGNMRNSGFTLVEVLVSAAVLSTVMMATVTVFTLFAKNDRTAVDLLRLESEARTVLLRIAEQTREGYVDYDFYTAAPSQEPAFLALRSFNGEQTVWWFYGAGTQKDLYLCVVPSLQETCDKTVDPSTDTQWSAVNTEHIRFSTGRFSLTPDTSPYFDTGGAEPVSSQAPLITVFLRLSNDTQQTGLIQTSFTTRFYVR